MCNDNNGMHITAQSLENVTFCFHLHLNNSDQLIHVSTCNLYSRVLCLQYRVLLSHIQCYLIGINVESEVSFGDQIEGRSSTFFVVKSLL